MIKEIIMQLTNGVCFTQLTNIRHQTEHGFSEINIYIQKGNKVYTSLRLKKKKKPIQMYKCDDA